MPKLSELIAQSGNASTPKPRLKLSDVQQQSGAYNVASEMSPLDRFGAGYSYGVKRTGQGLSQLMSHAIGGAQAQLDPGFAQNPMLGLPLLAARLAASPERRAQEIGQMDRNIAEEARIFNEGLGKYTSGKAGSITGGVVATGPLAGPGRATTWLGTLGRGAATGGIGAATQPVDDPENFAKQKAAQVGLGALFGGGTAGALRGVQSGLERLLPRNVTAQVVNASQRLFGDKGFAKEGEALAQRTGVTGLSPGAISGNKVQTMGENMARQSIFSRDMAFEADKKVAQQIHDYIGGVMQRVKAGSVAPDEAGKVVQQTVRNGVRALADIRDKQAAKDYGLVRKLIGNGPSPIRPTALADKLQSVVDEYGGVMGKDAETVAGWAGKQLANLEPVANSLDKLLQTRRFFSKAAAGAANIFENVNPGMQRRIAAQMVGAIDDDLARAADKLPGNLGSALKTANANYAALQRNIQAVEASPLGRLVGDDVASELTGAFNTVAPEKVIERIRGLTPSEIGMVRGQLEKWNPDAWAGVKRRVLEDALSTAENAAPSEGANVLALRGNAFINALTRGDKDGGKLKAMFTGAEQKQIADAFNVIKRFGDKTGYNFSGTGPYNEAAGVINALKDWTLKGTASAAGSVLGTRSIARLMLDSQGRQAVMQLARLPPQSRQAQQAAAYIVALVNAPDAAEALTNPEQQPNQRASGQQNPGGY